VSDEQRRWTDSSLPPGNSDKVTRREVYELITTVRDENARGRHDQTDRLAAHIGRVENELEDRMDRIEASVRALQDAQNRQDGALAFIRFVGVVGLVTAMLTLIALVIRVVTFPGPVL
jgi:hypothetical protein